MCSFSVYSFHPILLSNVSLVFLCRTASVQRAYHIYTNAELSDGFPIPIVGAAFRVNDRIQQRHISDVLAHPIQSILTIGSDEK